MSARSWRGFLEFGLSVEEVGGFFDGELEDVADGESVEADFEGGGVVALAVAGVAIDPGGGKEVHFEFDASVAFAFGALAFAVVEGEARGGVAAHAGFGELGEEGTDVVEEFDVGGGAGAGGFADGGLVDFEAVFDGFKSAGGFEGGCGIVL